MGRAYRALATTGFVVNIRPHARSSPKDSHWPRNCARRRSCQSPATCVVVDADPRWLRALRMVDRGNGGPPTGVRRLREYVGENASESFVTSMSSLPMYRFVDLFRACEDWAQRNDAHPIDMDCAASLGELLGRTWPEANRGAAQAPVSSAYPIGPEQEAFFPSSRFWATYSPRATCVRFTREPHMPRIRIEVAATDRETTETTLAAILKRSVEESIFRGQRVAVENSPAVMHEDDYGIATAAGPMALRFHTLSEIKDDDIVIESEIEEMLRRNIVDPQTHRQAFRAQSIPTQRGVLFFGPPGTR